jgi:hypothetical protein
MTPKEVAIAAPRRSMTVLDVAVLVGLAGVGLGAYQWIQQGLFPGWVWLLELGLPGRNEWTTLRAMVTASDLCSMLVPVAGPWTLALVVLRLGSLPRARWRRARRQPGMAGCLAVAVTWLWTLLALLAVLAMEHADPGRVTRAGHVWARRYLADSLFMYLGAAVAVVWVVQALGGRWTRPSDWIERLARLVGWAWILIGFVWTMRTYLEFLE